MLSNFARAGLGALLLSLALGASAQDVPAPVVEPAATAPAATVPVAPVDAALPAAPAPAAVPMVGTGTLVVDVLPFTSEVDLKKKVRAQLESGGLEWGQHGDRIVFSLVNKRFINFDMGYFTRYGSQQTLQLPAGEYRITGVGFNASFGFDVNKMLSRGAWFNEDVVRFVVEPGKTTKMTVNPVIRKDNAFLINVFMPELLVSIATDAGTSAPVSIAASLPTSVKWDDYKGDLKFAKQP
jgi:hypothetical protein